MLNPLRSLLFATLAVALLGAGQATAITYDFTGLSGSNPLGLGTGSLGHRVDTSSGGLDVTIRAFDRRGNRGILHRNRNGLGVATNPAGNSVASPERIRFIFDGSVVAVDALIFERGRSDGSLELWIDGSYHSTVEWTSGRGTMVTHALVGATGRRFEFRGDQRSFRLAAFSVDAATSPVPEPSAALLFGVGAAVVSNGIRRRS